MSNTFITYFGVENGYFFKEFPDGGFVQQRGTQNPKDIKSVSVESAVVFDNCYNTISRDGRIDLYSNGTFRVTPEGFDMEMLLNPLEKEFHLPSVFVEHGHIFSLDFESISDVCECSSKIFGVVDNPSESPWIFLLCLITDQLDGLVFKNSICSIQNIFSVNNLVLEVPSLTDYKMCS